MEKKHIGELIKEYFLKSGLKHSQFAELIHCHRNNVYDIFTRQNLDVELLGRISKILAHNFFEDIAKDLDLVAPKEETEEEVMNGKAVTQMFNEVPKALKALGLKGNIIFGEEYGEQYDEKLPEFFLYPYYIAFTKGGYLKEKTGEIEGGLHYEQFTSPSGKIIYVMTNYLSGTQIIDAKLEYMNDDEWIEFLRFALDTIDNHFSSESLSTIRENMANL